MNTEIERKFLVLSDAWRAAADDGLHYEQGYISSDPEKMTVRVRLAGDHGFLTLKGPAEGFSRPEMEYEIPVDDARYMLEHFCGNLIVSKTRYRFKTNGLTWEIDVFSGPNTGLVLAEIELESEDQPFERPEWLGEEVSHDSRYYNAALAGNPFSKWGSHETLT